MHVCSASDRLRTRLKLCGPRAVPGAGRAMTGGAELPEQLFAPQHVGEARGQVECSGGPKGVGKLLIQGVKFGWLRVARRCGREGVEQEPDGSRIGRIEPLRNVFGIA